MYIFDYNIKVKKPEMYKKLGSFYLKFFFTLKINDDS